MEFISHFTTRTRKSICSLVLYSLLLAVTLPEQATAQLTLIPDPELRTYLNYLVPGCVDGAGYLDPAYPGVQQIDTLGPPICVEDLTGIDQLGGVVYLACSYTCTPGDAPIVVFPPNVRSISLRNFVASDGSPTLFPPFPVSVTHISIGEWWSQSEIVLPALPPALKRLKMWGVGDGVPVQSLPALPSTLESIYIAPQCGLTTMPVLPAGLDTLILDGFLLNLDSLNAGLKYLDLHGADGHCLPLLPDSLTYLYSDVDCIPNLPASLVAGGIGFGVPIASAPLCSVVNSTCPGPGSSIQGVVYIDTNGNGVQDAGEVPYPNTTVEVQPNSYIAGVDGTGSYEIGVPPGSYTIAPLIPMQYVAAVNPPTHNANFSAFQQIDQQNDFGVELIANIQDLTMGMYIGAARPGYTNEAYLYYRNVGTQVQGGSISLLFDDDQVFAASDPAPDAITGTTLTWNFSNLQVGELRYISTMLNTPVGTALGTPIDHAAIADPLATDQTPGDNNAASSSEVFGSFDPNDKIVEPEQLTPAQVVAGERVNYTIRFQNTGTFLAERVVITDTLSSDLQWNTMQLIAASHEHTWYINGGVLHVIFNDIMLPDSTNDEPGSHGFVKFSMVPVSTLMLGATVQNIANIYFDFNEPVITNAAVFTIDNNVEVGEAPVDGMSLSPNPVGDVLTLILDKSRSSALFEVLDVSGRVVMRGALTGVRAQLDVSALRAGSYQVSIDHGTSTSRFVKH